MKVDGRGSEGSRTTGRTDEASAQGDGRCRSLPSSSLFDELTPNVRLALEREVEWISLPAGRVLFKRGDFADALYVVTSGSLGVIVGEPTATHELVNQLYAGDTVGEMALLSERPRSATVVALRDTSLLRIGKGTFSTLIATQPGAMHRLTKQLVDRLESTMLPRETATAPRTLAVVPLDPGAPVGWLGDELVCALARLGLRAVILRGLPATETLDCLHSIETAHDLTLYQGRPDTSDWTLTCIGQADRILFVTVAASSQGERFSAARCIPDLPWRLAELVVVQDARAQMPAPAASLLRELPVRGHYHIRDRKAEDVARLARHIVGRAVGVVLSGGGARGYGHIGVIRALREIGVPMDVAGGTSFGSIVAAGLACEWGTEELVARFRAAFEQSNPLNDYAFPFVALTKGRKVSRLLREHFGDRTIEELWRPYFTVATNLSTGTLKVLRKGFVWDALRASIALPGLLPPWVIDDQVLVDGAVMNNLPTDVMRAMRHGPVVAVDVTRYETLSVARPVRSRRLWRLLTGQEFDGPSIVNTLIRSAHIGGDVQAKLSRDLADVLLEPPLANMDLRDWKSFDRAVEAGYRYTLKKSSDLQRLMTGTVAPSGRRRGAIVG
jgi:NTE family protein